MNNNQKSQLFTELTSSEGAAVSGGATLNIYGAYAIRAGADPLFDPGDDLYINVNSKKVFGPQKNVDSGDFVKVFKSQKFSRFAKIQLMDKDPDKDDNLGGFTISSRPTNGIKRAFVSGSGSKYAVFYSVI